RAARTSRRSGGAASAGWRRSGGSRRAALWASAAPLAAGQFDGLVVYRTWLSPRFTLPRSQSGSTTESPRAPSRIGQSGQAIAVSACSVTRWCVSAVNLGLDLVVQFCRPGGYKPDSSLIVFSYTPMTPPTTVAV